MFATLTTLLALASFAVLPPRILAASTENPSSLFRTTSLDSKAGLAWPNGDYNNIVQYQSAKVSWYYTWSPSPVHNTELSFVPMLWGKTQTEQFSNTISSTIDQYQVTHVLGMNEPQQSGQSELTAEEGVELWKQYLEPLKSRNIRLGSPAPSSAPSGKTWLLDFLQQCGGDCTVDFIALHWYDVNATQFIAYLQDFHDTFQRPIWVTEWACQNFNGGPQCDPDDVREFLKETQGFMDQTEWVERYSWFGAFKDLQGVNEDNALMGKDGRITELGQQYINDNTTTPSSSGPTVSAATVPSSRTVLLPLAIVMFMISILL